MKGSRIVKTGAAAVSLLYAFGMPLLTAQVEVLPDETRAAHLKTFERLKAENGPFQKHLKRLEGASDTRKINAARVASDFVRTGASGPVVFYSVPAAGEARTELFALPDTITGVHDLYFRFIQPNVSLLSWQFFSPLQGQ